jgi:hypothetical protein
LFFWFWQSPKCNASLPPKKISPKTVILFARPLYFEYYRKEENEKPWTDDKKLVTLGQNLSWWFLKDRFFDGGLVRLVISRQFNFLVLSCQLKSSYLSIYLPSNFLIIAVFKKALRNGDVSTIQLPGNTPTKTEQK